MAAPCSPKSIFNRPIIPSSSASSSPSPSLPSFLRPPNPSLLSLKLTRFHFPDIIPTALKTVQSHDTHPHKLDHVASDSETKPTILVSEKLGDAGLSPLRTFGNVDCSYDLSPDQLCDKISSCDALIVRSGTKVTRQVFEAGKGRLKVVGRAGVGIDNVDLQAATEFGCLVVNAPIANTVAAAEHGIALLVAMARNVAQADASVKAGA
ncbi:hypothetical protein SLE2022_150920 [Rubroshorea leprosula]